MPHDHDSTPFSSGPGVHAVDAPVRPAHPFVSSESLNFFPRLSTLRPLFLGTHDLSRAAAFKSAFSPRTRKGRRKNILYYKRRYIQ